MQAQFWVDQHLPVLVAEFLRSHQEYRSSHLNSNNLLSVDVILLVQDLLDLHDLAQLLHQVPNGNLLLQRLGDIRLLLPEQLLNQLHFS